MLDDKQWNGFLFYPTRRFHTHAASAMAPTHASVRMGQGVYFTSCVCTIVTGMGTYNKGTSVTLTAVPNQGYRFVSWGDESTDNPRTVTANENGVIYSAIFEPEA